MYNNITREFGRLAIADITCFSPQNHLIIIHSPILSFTNLMSTSCICHKMFLWVQRRRVITYSIILESGLIIQTFCFTWACFLWEWVACGCSLLACVLIIYHVLFSICEMLCPMHVKVSLSPHRPPCFPWSPFYEPAWAGASQTKTPSGL